MQQPSWRERAPRHSRSGGDGEGSQHQSQAVVGCSVVGIQPNGLTKRELRLPHLPLSVKGDAKHEMGIGVVGPEPDRRANRAIASSCFPCSVRALPRLKWASASASRWDLRNREPESPVSTSHGRSSHTGLRSDRHVLGDDYVVADQSLHARPGSGPAPLRSVDTSMRPKRSKIRQPRHRKRPVKESG